MSSPHLDRTALEPDASGIPRPWKGRDAEAWARQIGVPRLELHRRLPSTNSYLCDLIPDGALPFTTIVADEQTAGRGRDGSGWHSPSDTGLWLSVLLALESQGTAGVLPLAAGVAIAIAIEKVAKVSVGLKWPNDILVGPRKVGGILCESAGDSGQLVAVGIGVNLRRPAAGFPPQLASSVAFLDEVGGRSTTEPELTKQVIEELRRWTQPIPNTLSGRLRMEWESRDRLQGRQVRLESGIVGVATGTSPEGALEVAAADGSLLRVRAGRVRIKESGGSAALYAAGRPRSNEGVR